MTALMIFLRIIHIFSGIFWVGTNLFFLFFFQPSLKAAGPAGGSVMGKLVLTKFPMVIALASISTVLAGFVMYTLDSKGFQLNWIASPAGLVLTIGATAGILAAAVGLFIQRPATLRMADLSKEIQAAGGTPTPAQLAEMQMLTKKVADATRWGVVLTVIAVLGMSSARELGDI